MSLQKFGRILVRARFPNRNSNPEITTRRQFSKNKGAFATSKLFVTIRGFMNPFFSEGIIDPGKKLKQTIRQSRLSVQFYEKKLAVSAFNSSRNPRVDPVIDQLGIARLLHILWFHAN